jgi:cytochrome P450
VSAFSEPLPMMVISHILGFPIDAIKKYKKLSDAVTVVQTGYQLLDAEEDMDEVHRTFGELMTFLNDQVSDRRARPRDDTLSLVVNPPPDSGLPRLNQVQLVGVAQALLSAGNETTTLMLGNLMYRLVTNVQERERLIANRSGVRKFIEECLRMDSPAQWLPRTCLVDHEVAGITIPAGARVLLMWSAANRDGEMYPEPAEFNSQRDSLNRHVGFGHGEHLCLGAPLARLEGRLAVDAILTRLKDPRLDGPDAARRLPSVALGGFKELRIRFDSLQPVAV